MTSHSLDRIPDLHAAQRTFFASGKTREYNFRVKQLQQLKKLFTENEKALQQALASDLGKNADEALLTEIVTTSLEVSDALSKLKTWMATEPCAISSLLLPASCGIR